MPLKHPSTNTPFGRLNDRQQMRRSDIEDFLNAWHQEANAKRANQDAWQEIPEDALTTVNRLSASPADDITAQRDRLNAIRAQSAESRARGESARGIDPMSEPEFAEHRARLHEEMSAPSKLIGAGLGLAGGLAAPLMVPAAPVLSGAALNALGGALPNWLMSTPEGIGQDAVAGGAMGLAASRIHPLAAIPAALASYAATSTPDAEAGAMRRLFSGLSTPNRLNRPFYATTDPVYASRRAIQKSNPDDPMFVHMPKVDEDLLIQFGKMYDTRKAPEAFSKFPRGEAVAGEDIYSALKPLADEHADHIVREMGYAGHERPNSGDFGNGQWFRISDPSKVTQQFAGGGSVAGAAKRLAQRAMSEAGDVDAVMAPQGALSVIKNKGGNWLTGSVEDALKGLKKYDDMAQGVVPGRPNAAINSFIDKQLTRYVKNEMATPDDPVRALAERGVLHFTPEEGGNMSMRLGMAARNRQRVGEFGLAGEGVSPLAKQWETLSDSVMSPRTVGEQLRAESPHNAETMPWLEKLHPGSQLHAIERQMRGDPLNWGHLTDELANALNPESGLPRHLLLDPKSMDRVSVPQAVERVAQINAWRAAQKAEADAMKANNAATHLHKEYPGKGFKWVELRQQQVPQDKIRTVNTPHGWRVEDKFLTPRFTADPRHYPSEAEALAAHASRRDESPEGMQALADALKYEGDTMGHCVGGYCDDVASGRSRIYSLRDAKGQPHVTIEVEPSLNTTTIEQNGKLVEVPDPDEMPSIKQIKGKANRAPNEEYLPFVQDFVKAGKWSDVGDLQNTGLFRVLPGQKWPGFAEDMPAGFWTIEDAEKQAIEKGMDPEVLQSWLSKLRNPHSGFAHGGTVNTNNLTVGRLRDIIASLNQEQTDA